MGKLNNLMPKKSEKITSPEEAAKLVELVEEPVKPKEEREANWLEVEQKKMEFNAEYTRLASGLPIEPDYKKYMTSKLEDIIVNAIAVSRELGEFHQDECSAWTEQDAKFRSKDITVKYYDLFQTDVEIEYLKAGCEYDKDEVFKAHKPDDAESYKKDSKNKFESIVEINKRGCFSGTYFILTFNKDEKWIKRLNELFEEAIKKARQDPKKDANGLYLEGPK